MSETNGHKSLLEALLAVQAGAPTLPKDKTAKVRMKAGGEYTYRYTDLATVVEQVGPKLTDHGLVWITKPSSDEHGNPVLGYKLAHAPSGEFEAGEMPLMLGGAADSQALGSALTYARRYALCAVLNLVADDDDDGHRASQRKGSGASSDAPTDAQMKELGRQVKRNQPLPPSTLAACLLSVGATGIQVEDLETGAWATKVNRAQVSGLIDLFKSGQIPTGESDIPSDPDPVPSSVAEEAGDLPWSES